VPIWSPPPWEDYKRCLRKAVEEVLTRETPKNVYDFIAKVLDRCFECMKERRRVIPDAYY